MTTRRLKPGTREDFRAAWRPGRYPDGMLRAYEYWAEDRDEVVGISLWESPEARERYRLSEVEAERRRAMAPYVLEEHSGFDVGRELTIPRD
jgi:heme-degrading monooxygenase HmoA